MIENGTLEATDIAEGLTKYAVRDIRLGPARDGSTFEEKSVRETDKCVLLTQSTSKRNMTTSR